MRWSKEGCKIRKEVPPPLICRNTSRFCRSHSVTCVPLTILFLISPFELGCFSSFLLIHTTSSFALSPAAPPVLANSPLHHENNTYAHLEKRERNWWCTYTQTHVIPFTSHIYAQSPLHRSIKTCPPMRTHSRFTTLFSLVSFLPLIKNTYK